MNNKVIILNGSPRMKSSSSNIIAEFLENKYSKKGMIG